MLIILKKRLFYYVGILLLVAALLMIVHNNIRQLFSYQFLWGPLFVLLLLLFDAKVFVNKLLLLTIVGGILFTGILQYTVWKYANDWYKKMIFQDFRAMLYAVALFTYLKKNKNVKDWCTFSKIGTVFLLITAIMTIIATFIHPLIVRASYSSLRENIENYEMITRLGIGSYGFLTAIITLFPIWIYFYKKSQTMRIWISKRSIILIICVFYFVILRAQVFANILTATFIIIVSFLGVKRLYTSIFLVTLAIVIFLLIPKEVYANLLIFFSQYFDANSEVYLKLTDMAGFIVNPIIDKTTQAGSRAIRYNELWNVFIHRPLLGDASYNSSFDEDIALGGHLFWMSRLALWGIFGFLGYIYIVFKLIKSAFILFDREFKFYYLLAVLSTIVLGLIKALYWYELWLLFLVIIPGLYFSHIYYLQKVKSN